MFKSSERCLTRRLDNKKGTTFLIVIKKFATKIKVLLKNQKLIKIFGIVLQNVQKQNIE